MTQSPSLAPITWRGGPDLIVYAARYALTRPAHASHAPLMLLRWLQANAGQLTTAAQRIIVADITTWLEGDGLELDRADREVWLLALAALGVRRRPSPSAPDPVPARRRGDRKGAA